MKKTDIALIIIIISISAGVSYWIASITIGKANEQPISVKTIDAIKVDDQKVDERVFAKNAINPTVEATISGTDLTSFMNGDTTSNEGDAPKVNDADSGAQQTSEE